MLKKLIRFLLIPFLTIICGPSIAANTSPYVTSGDCDGFPKINLQTEPGMCVGLVAGNLGFTRGVAALGSDVYVLDLGGWHSKEKGRLFRLGNHGHAAPEVVLDHLNEPNSLIPAPGNTLYIGMLGKVVQFDPAAHSLKDVVVNLPQEGLHPFPALAAASGGSLFINVGSATDHCEKADDSPPNPNAVCTETVAALRRGTIIQVMPQATAIDARTIKPYVSGLRNSMALAVEAPAQLYAAVNARDAINLADPALSDEELPHDLFIKVKQGAQYGWPYCYDDNKPSPEYPKFDCSKKQLPTALLPAHAAPLGMLFYQGDVLPGLKGRLVIGYHGYRAAGHRVMAFSLDTDGALHSPVEIISGWNAKPGDHPQGAPMGLFELKDGSILITEDQNGTLLRLSLRR